MPSQDPAEFFARPRHPDHRRYEILRAFYHEGLTAAEVASRFQITVGSVYALTREFRQLDDPISTLFQPPVPPGRPARKVSANTRERILLLRDRNLSVPDIKAQLDAEDPAAPGERAIQRVLAEAGRPRLPRRSRAPRAAAIASTELPA